ncbi:MAG: glycerophosphodiester phosphodiesterase [Actinobacteria bacterium]|nr:glycerophosphodiester phosphodiesterase [Actinomycetota bacterium]
MTYIFGHRGLPRIYRENSITGLNKAFDHCDFVETDLRITKDNNIIFYHDSFIKDFFIEDLTLNEIELLLPDIDMSDMIFTSRTQITGNVNFEIKSDDTKKENLEVLIKKIINMATYDDIISSFNWEVIHNYKDSFNCKYGIILDNEDNLFEATALSNHDNQIMFMVSNNVINSRNFNLPLNRTVVWTVNDEKEFERLMQIGLYGIITDIPDTMQLYKK